MVEVASIVIGIFSAGIFLAHAVDAYHAQSAVGRTTGRRPTAIIRR
jgi:hypothetical protein